jgi:hypothetical protein
MLTAKFPPLPTADFKIQRSNAFDKHKNDFLHHLREMFRAQIAFFPVPFFLAIAFFPFVDIERRINCQQVKKQLFMYAP